MKTDGSAFNFPEGELLLIDKPLEWTSFDVVNKIRWTISRTTGIKKIKVGHAGTLDPLATGLLIVCTGKFTKRIEEFQSLQKEYTGTFLLGETTPSFDLETEVDHTFPIDHIDEPLLVAAAQGFVGDIEQVPPVYSAIKIKGKRAYEKARNNDDVKLKARKVSVSVFEITGIRLPDIDFKISCSKGTYIRSIARDFGKKLNSGAHLTSLRRTKIGEYDVNNAMSVEEFEKQLKSTQK